MDRLTFKQRFNVPEKDIALDFKDTDGDDLILNAYSYGECIELEVLSHTGCMVLNRQDARIFANMLLELTEEE